MFYSVIIPVYNRPDEIDELLTSLTKQNYKNFEVLIIEDGSENRCENIVQNYKEKLDISYYFKENSGQGFSRNYGFERSKGDYFVVFDSDCLIPDHYFAVVNRFLNLNMADCWGGPDRAHPSFTKLQKAISFSMTSFLTTGGIRGNKNQLETFLPRSFNMGISKEVYEKTGGYKITRMGEDLEFSIRIKKLGFTTALISDAFVYHKRRTSFKQFYKQLHFFGRARVNLFRFYPDSLKLLHFFPFLFALGLLVTVLLSFIQLYTALILATGYLTYGILLFFGSLINEKSVPVAVLSVVAGFIQLLAYGAGFSSEMTRYLFYER